MKRREFITILGGAVTYRAIAAVGQQIERARRLGVLMGYAESDPDAQTNVTAFQEALQTLGWV